MGLNAFGPMLTRATMFSMTTDWDQWHREALAAGVSAELAQLGQEILRNHVQHGHDLVPDPGVWRMAEHPGYMLELAIRAPVTAFHDFNAQIIGAAGEDGEVGAFALLVDQLGSEEAVDAALYREQREAERLKVETRAIV